MMAAKASYANIFVTPCATMNNGSVNVDVCDGGTRAEPGSLAGGAVVEWMSSANFALMESATLWKVDATEAALRAERGLDRFS